MLDDFRPDCRMKGVDRPPGRGVPGPSKRTGTAGHTGWGGAVGILFLLGVAGPAVAAARKPLVGRIRTLAPRCRSYGPVAAEVTLDWRGTKLLEGRLEVTFVRGGSVLGRSLSADMALTGGRQCYRVLLPAPRTQDYGSEVDARLRFLTKDGAFGLESHPVYVPNRSQRSLTVCVGEPRTTPGPATLALVSSLRLEEFDPRLRTSRSTGVLERPLSTLPAYLLPEDLPAQPLGYCPFDVVLLPGDGFALARERQIEALLRWVEAGGSVCVVPGGTLKPYHVRFLNDLAAAGADGPTFISGPEGRLGPPPVIPQGNAIGRFGLAFHAGIGRAVVVLDPPRKEKDLEDPAWRRAVAFLWKVRASEVASVLERAARAARGLLPDAPTDEQGRGRRRPRPRPKAPGGFGNVPLPAGGTLFDALIPKSIRIIPFWVVVTILLLFVAVIGPVDYYGLGLLRRRKLTWVLFPVASIGFAVFTMLLSEWYMGRTDRRRAVEFVDLGAGGKVLRRSRYEVVFVARHRDVVTEVESGIFSPVLSRSMQEYQYMYRQPGYGRSSGGPAPLYEGRVPARYRVTQELRQWQPQMNRLFWIGPTEEGGGSPAAPDGINLDWDSLGRAAAIGPGAYGEVFGRGGRRAGGYLCVYSGEALLLTAKGPRELGGSLPGIPQQFLKEACVRPEAGLFSVVSQVSPTGGANFEDLPLIDPTDPGQRLLVAVVRRGENVLVFRRLYHGDGHP